MLYKKKKKKKTTTFFFFAGNLASSGCIKVLRMSNGIARGPSSHLFRRRHHHLKKNLLFLFFFFFYESNILLFWWPLKLDSPPNLNWGFLPSQFEDEFAGIDGVEFDGKVKRLGSRAWMNEQVASFNQHLVTMTEKRKWQSHTAVLTKPKEEKTKEISYFLPFNCWITFLLGSSHCCVYIRKREREKKRRHELSESSHDTDTPT